MDLPTGNVVQFGKMSVTVDYSPWQRNLLLLGDGTIYLGNGIGYYKIASSTSATRY